MDHHIETPLSFDDMAQGILHSYHTQSDALGPSKIATYLRCPRQYQYQYIERIPAPSSPAAALGSTFHAIVKQARDLHWTPDCAPQAADALTELWEIVRPETSDPKCPKTAKAFREARDTWLPRYLEWSENHIDIAVEEFFDFEVATDGPALRLQGTVDRVYRADGLTVISDVKTGQNLDGDPDSHLQLSLYSYAYRQLSGAAEDAVEFYMARKEKLEDRVIRSRRTQEYLEHVIRDVVTPVAYAIDAGLFPCNPANKFGCGYCDYQQTCPVGRGVS